MAVPAHGAWAVTQVVRGSSRFRYAYYEQVLDVVGPAGQRSHSGSTHGFLRHVPSAEAMSKESGPDTFDLMEPVVNHGWRGRVLLGGVLYARHYPPGDGKVDRTRPSCHSITHSGSRIQRAVEVKSMLRSKFCLCRTLGVTFVRLWMKVFLYCNTALGKLEHRH